MTVSVDNDDYIVENRRTNSFSRIQYFGDTVDSRIVPVEDMSVVESRGKVTQLVSIKSSAIQSWTEPHRRNPLFRGMRVIFS